MGRLVALIEPFYPKGERGRPPLEVELMLRVYFLQQWYGLADEALEDALHDSRSMRAFVGGEVVPDAITLLKFRYLLEAHDLTKRLLAEINAVLAERGAFLRAGAIMEATIIAAAPSTKNKELTLALEKSKAQMRALAEHPCPSSKTASSIARRATAGWPRTRRNCIRFLPWPTWRSSGAPRTWNPPPRKERAEHHKRSKWRPSHFPRRATASKTLSPPITHHPPLIKSAVP